MYSPTDYKDFNAAKYMIDQYGSGQTRLGDSYDIDFSAPNAPVTMKSQGPSGGEVAANVGTSGAVGGALGGLGGAGIAAGGALLTSYLAQKAADERQRRQNAAAIEQNYAQNQTNAYNTILGNLRGALR